MKANKHFKLDKEVKRMQALMDFPKHVHTVGKPVGVDPRGNMLPGRISRSNGHDFKNQMIDAQFRPLKAKPLALNETEAA